jgi:ribosomal protein S18 acetylase RimI-like enzyme
VTVAVEIRRVDYAEAREAAALVDLLDAYARDPLGGGEGLGETARRDLIPRLAALPHAVSLLAWREDEAVGLLNAFETLSTFAARPVLNVHDLAVAPAWRGRGIGTQLLAAATALARARGCCKLTLEVLAHNPAAALYRRAGFRLYQLDPAHGSAEFWEKPLPD